MTVHRNSGLLHTKAIYNKFKATMHLNKGLLTSVVVYCINIYSQYNLHLASIKPQSTATIPWSQGQIWYDSSNAERCTAQLGLLGVLLWLFQLARHPFLGHRVFALPAQLFARPSAGVTKLPITHLIPCSICWHNHMQCHSQSWFCQNKARWGYQAILLQHGLIFFWQRTKLH